MDDTQSVDYRYLLSRLSGGGIKGMPNDVFSVDDGTQGYVEPRFMVTHDEEANPSAILISARGAAGKSTTAKMLSSALQAPIWSLHKDKSVSHASVYQLLSRYLNTLDPIDAVKGLKNPLMIIDSVDEARARVSASSWDEFLDALIDFSKVGLKFVLMGRTQTITDLWTHLEDSGVTTLWYEISHFNSESSDSYVDARCSAIDRADFDPNNLAYISAKKAVLDALRDRVSSDDSEKFVGYPPVLDAVSALLVNGANFQNVRNSFETKGFSRETEVLEKILTELVEREKTKVDPMIKELGISHIEECYSLKEQFKWLLHDLEQGDEPQLKHIESHSTRRNYREQIQQFLQDHPFRSGGHWASPVFRAYVAYSLFDQIPENLVFDVGNNTGMLFEFVSGLTRDNPVVSEKQFAALHASMIAGKRHGTELLTSVVDDSESLSATFRVSEDGGDTSLRVDVALNCADNFELYAPLSFLDVSTNGKVSIEKIHGDELSMGPDFSIVCNELDVHGSRISFERREKNVRSDESPSGPGSNSGSVYIEVIRSVKLPFNIAGQLPGRDMLEIIQPAGHGMSYPWVDYATPASNPVPEVDDRAIRFLKKLMNLTRSHGHAGDRAVFSKKFEGRQGLPTQPYHRALEVLRHNGVIYEESELIFISASWEPHRFDGKATSGDYSLSHHLEAWLPVLVELSEQIRK